ncbi:hypothetical protein GCM10023192_18580 [Amycolatopsis samaneae]
MFAVLFAMVVALFGGVTAAEAVSAPASFSTQQNKCGDLSGYKHVKLSSLPKQATDTYKLIQSGGPFPYPGKDGSVFTNREKVLPACASKYYHEYTVITPGSSNRGTRRIVSGAHEYFYTGDHYKTFQVIDV